MTTHVAFGLCAFCLVVSAVAGKSFIEYEIIRKQIFNPLECRGNYSVTSSSSYICSKRQHTAIEKQVSRTDRHKVHLHLPLCFHPIIWRWYTGRWWVDCYIWYSDNPPRPLMIAVPNVTAHPTTASVTIALLLYNCPLLCGFNYITLNFNVA